MDTEAMAVRCVGIDVGKDRIEIHIRPDAIAFGCDTDANRLDHLVTRLKPLKPMVIALEATRGRRRTSWPDALPVVVAADFASRQRVDTQ